VLVRIFVSAYLCDQPSAFQFVSFHDEKCGLDKKMREARESEMESPLLTGKGSFVKMFNE